MKKNWQLPSYDDAKRRRIEQSEVIYNTFNLSEDQKILGKHKSYYIRTYGCQANERDTEVLAGILEQMSYTKTSSIEEADVILLNTCSIRENANNKVFGEIGQLKHIKTANPDVIIGVCGCMTQEEVIVKKILKTYPQVDLIFGTHNIHHLADLLTQAHFTKERTVQVFSEEGDIIENLPSTRAQKHKAWVNIMYGCDKFCTYCIVPMTRGKQRSRLLEDIIEEVNQLVLDNYKEITLLGQNVNAYGKDRQMQDGFATLLEAIANTGIPRVRFMTSHPWDFTDKMIDVIAKYPNIMPYIHLPLQSGSNKVLKLMGRRYTQEEYLTLFDKIKKAIPNCAVSTDIIVGFPNETEDDFQKTLDVFNHCKYDNAYTFIFSPRNSTPAANMESVNSPQENKKRLLQLNELVKKYSLERNQEYINQTVEVLVDGFSKKDESIYTGYTPSSKVVNFKADDINIGDIVRVKINKVKTWYLSGELVK
ncbi:MAG: tRNA (N6-isopentenyl adenosine(37)-C2)-methylthiotransferase MiaB [Erysipelothrix sp.]|nr:tRNA (N6-isopentenyl adenosine(37)-C2)-methylthiotransferase MiaB [Erysipelothrix sp.]